MSMEILIYNWKDKKNPDRGGAEISLFEIATRLVRDGHNVTLFARTFDGALPEEAVGGVQVVRRGGLLTTYWHGYRYYRSLVHKPDVVVDILNTLIWQTPLYVKGKHFAYVNQLAREVLLCELPPVIAQIAYYLERLQFFFYKKTPFICIAPSVKEDLVSIGIPRESITPIRLGLDHAEFSPGTKAATPTFLCINRLVKMKRTDACIEAMHHVVNTYPNAVLNIIGFGYDKPRLEKMVRDLKLEQNVFFKKVPFFAIGEESRTSLMQSAWALLFPSVKEGWGMTVTEAGACKTPSIVSDVTGLKDAVHANKTGLVLSKHPTPEEISRAMIQLIEDQSLRERLSVGALAWAGEMDWEKTYQEFRAIIGA